MNDLIKQNRNSILKIAEKHGAKKIRLFGSMAKGTADKDSDVDLLVDMNPGTTLLNIVAIKQDLEDLLGYDVDVVTESAISPYIRENILKDTISL